MSNYHHDETFPKADPADHVMVADRKAPLAKSRCGAENLSVQAIVRKRLSEGKT